MKAMELHWLTMSAKTQTDILVTIGCVIITQ